MSEQEMIARLRAEMKAAQDRWQAVADSGGVRVAGVLVTENEAQIALGVIDHFMPMVEALTTLEASRTPGMVMVPREPTEAMLVKGYTAYHAGATNAPDLWRNIWTAMLAASPTPTPSGAE